MATLNVLLNVEEVELGERLRESRNETRRMSSPVCCSLICSFLAYLNFAAVDGGLSGLERSFRSTGTQRSVLFITILICLLNQTYLTNVLAIKMTPQKANAQRSHYREEETREP